MPALKGKPKRAGTIRQWLERRGVPAYDKYAVIYLDGLKMAVRVTPAQIPHGLTPGQALTELRAKNPGWTPALLRSVDPDPGRCQVTLFLDDLIPLLHAYEERD